MSPITDAFARLISAWQALPPNTRGAIWLMLNAVISTVLVVLVRMLGRDLPTAQLVFIRTFIGLCIIVPIVLRMGRVAYATNRMDMHLVRGVLTFASMMCYYYVYSFLPLADVTALIFTMPLFLIVLSFLVMGEKVGWRRTTATAVGFAGVIVMMRPGHSGLEPALLLALLIGFMDAIIALVVKRLAMTERPITILFYTALFGFAFSSIPGIIEWRDPTQRELLLVAAIAVTTTLSQSVWILAWRVGETSAIAPFGYIQLVFAALAGYLLFAELPDLWTGLGAAIIGASAVYIMVREHRLRQHGRLQAKGAASAAQERTKP